jgi:uncharacterized SAM-binding protein YcdF (DUF218 family)
MFTFGVSSIHYIFKLKRMFFLLSKLLNFIIMPLVWIITLLLIATLSKDQFKREKYLVWSLALLLFFSNSFLFSVCMSLWELPQTNYKDLKTYQAGIVMGGVTGNHKEHDRIQFIRGADRLFQAIDLYKKGIIKKIVFTGGSGYVTKPELKEGAMVKQYILRLGIPADDFIVENESRNTYENALFTKQLLKDSCISGNLVLITSAFHMRRSLACFNKQGIYPDPFCVDVYAEKQANVFPFFISIEKLIIPSLEPLQDWTNFIHELIGYTVYKIAGYA